MRTTLHVLCIIAFLCATAGVEGQNSWATLGGLKSGQKIQIIEMNSKKHSGTFLSASDSAITFTERSSEKSIAKAHVRSVKLETQRRMRNTLIGTGVGFGAGAALGAAICSSSDSLCSPAEGAAGIGFFGVIIGAPVGALMPTGNVTIYTVESH